MQKELKNLVTMSTTLGAPQNDYVILGEGNTSSLVKDGTFWVKASGYQLPTIDETGFVRVSLKKAMAILEEPGLNDGAIKQKLLDAKVDPDTGQTPAPDDGIRPSTETVFHAICLNLDGINYVGHTHPTAINALTCSANFEEAVLGRLFPDEIVMCGPAPVVVPYVDPGIPLAIAIKQKIVDYIHQYNELPKVILMQNHGLVVLGGTAEQVLATTAMMVKTARVILGTYVMGGPHFLSDVNVSRIHTRPDELYRRKLLGGIN
ncbi:MAG: class II aldolase/adducin family protein [Anaerolineae bacterium]|nr:class II aldolase/adducin family protein [Anaerolineae bacterium]